MFGHQDDITAQDRKTDVTVQLPDDAIAALTAAAAVSDDQPVDQPSAADDAGQATAPARPSHTPSATSAIDGISVVQPSAQGSQLPSSYLEFLGAPGGHIPAPVRTTPAPQEVSEPVPVQESVTTDQDSHDFAADFSPEEQATPISVPSQSPSLFDLDEIKQAALSELSPLVHQLEQAPEERFKTVMMLIQASDNQALLRDAYAAAREIRDEKSRAEALLQVVNEINYFTRQQAG